MCVCAAEGFPVVPVRGIPLIPAERRASEGRATPRGTREREAAALTSNLSFFYFYVFVLTEMKNKSDLMTIGINANENVLS